MTLFRHTPINFEVLVCRTLPMPCPCPPAPVVPVIRTSYGLLIHLWVYCCSVLVELIEAVVSTLEKAQLLQEDLEAKTWWTTCSAVSVSEVMLLGHWVLEHLDLRMTDGYALLSPPLTPIWWFEALGITTRSLYSLIPWNDDLGRIRVASSDFCPYHLV